MKDGLYELRDMIGSADTTVVGASPANGSLRAVPLPFFPGSAGRLWQAWQVMCGRAYACRWPEVGELEAAIGHGLSQERQR